MLEERLTAFTSDKRGNIAVIFAIALVPVISFVGAAVDYSRANRARSTMQAAIDATALMLSKDLSTGAITSSQINAKAQTYFTALYTDTEASSVSVTATYSANAGAVGSTIQVNGSGSVATDFMKVAGFSNIPISTSSATAWGNARLRVAMALDNTGSMADNGKIGALQTAATNLITQLSGLAQNPGDVYVSVVPFAKVVNLGSSNYTQNWIDWSDWQNPPTPAVGDYRQPAEQLVLHRSGLDLPVHEQQQRFRLHNDSCQRQRQCFHNPIERHL